MTGRPASSAEVAREATRIAASGAGIEDRAAELLGLVRRVVPYEAAWIALVDDPARRYAELAGTGYGERVRDYLGTPELLDQVELVGLSSSPVPQRGRDSPVPLAELPVWGDYYLPDGYREGMAVGLFTADRRHLGVMVMSTDTPDHPTDAERDVVAALAPGSPPPSTRCGRCRCWPGLSATRGRASCWPAAAVPGRCPACPDTRCSCRARRC
ncbi:hypothetical protein [Plantactinospora sp. CA-290183]|uniref:hypothetical protein n=1 Tax=Plantactinospora sp. CA-290183 TaxID=3240006 RepID=UPI003D8F0FB6